MRNKLFILGSLLIVASMVLGACAAPAAEPQTIIQTVEVEKEVVKTVEVQVEGETMIVTATPEPMMAKEFKSADPSTYVVAQIGYPELIDPALTYETAGGEIIQNVYETLITYDKDNPIEFVPQLATEVPSLENGGITDDGLTYIFKIRQGVKFHDGTEMTPSDVAYSIQRGLLQGGYSSPQWLLTEPFLGVGVSDIAELVSPDLGDDPEGLQAADPALLLETCQKVTDAIVADDAAGTVTMHLASSWGPFLATLANGWGSVQSKAWEVSMGAWDGDCATWQNYYGRTSDELNEMGLGNQEMGTGPYKLDHWTPGEELVMTAFEDYWRTEPAWDGGPTGVPALKTVIIKSVDEFSTRFAMLQAGDADAVGIPLANYSQADELVGETCDILNDYACQPMEGNPDGQLRRYTNAVGVSRTDVFFTFDINAEGNNFIGSGQIDGNGIPADFFNDVHIRKAFAYCFNYDQYLSDALAGQGVRSNNIMLPGMIGYQDDSPIYTYDPAKCEEEFKASTWEGLWDTGFRMTIAYNTGNTARQTAAQIFQAEIGAVNPNFIIEVTGLPWPTFLKNQRASTLPIFISGWLEDIHDPHNWVVPYTTGTYGGRQNLPADLKAQFQDINSRGVTESDPAKRADIYHEFNQLMYDNVSVIPMFVVTGNTYMQRWVEGYYYNPISSGVYYYARSKQ